MRISKRFLRTSALLSVLLSLQIACGDAEETEEDEDETDDPTTVTSTSTDTATTTTTIATVATTGSISFNFTAHDKGDNSEDDHDLTSLKYKVTSIVGSTDGTNWINLYDNVNGFEFDAITGSSILTVDDITPGAYSHFMLKLAPTFKYTRKEASCTEQTTSFNTTYTMNMIFTTPTGADAYGYSFESIYFAPTSDTSAIVPNNPSSVSNRIFYLKDNLTVVAGETLNAYVGLRQEAYIAADSCETSTSLHTELGIAGDNTVAADLNATRESTDALVGNWFSSCEAISGTSNYLRQSTIFTAANNAAYFYQYVYSDSECSALLYYVGDFYYYRINEASTVVEGATDYDLLYSTSSVTIQDSSTVTSFNTDAICGKTDWAETTQYVSGDGSADCRVVQADNGDITYDIFQITDSTLSIGLEEAGYGDTEEARFRSLDTTTTYTLSQ